MNKKSNQQTLLEIMESLQDFYFEADRNGVLTYANSAFIKRLGGKSKKDVVGKHFRSFTDRSEIRDIFKKFKLLYETKKPIDPFEYKYLLKDGNPMIGEAYIFPIIEDEEVVGSRGFIRDTTGRVYAEVALEKTQSEYFALLDTLTDPYFEADHSGVITYANLGFVNTVGYKTREDVIGKHFRHFTDRSGIREIFKNFKLVFETKKPAPPFDFPSIYKDGTSMVGDAYISPILEGDKVVGTKGIIRDISERVKAEEFLREARTEAENRANDLASINLVSETVSRSLDLNEILNSVCKNLTSIFNIQSVEIGLLNSENNGVGLKAIHRIDGVKESPIESVMVFEEDNYLRIAIESRKIVVIQEASYTIDDTKIFHNTNQSGAIPTIISPLLVRNQSIGVIRMIAKELDANFSLNKIELVETITSQIAAAVDNAQLHSKTEMALGLAEHDLEIGRQIQSGFFPDYLPNIPGWEIATSFQAARQVSGDFYDIFQFNNSNLTTFIIADVCDKGVGAALFMVLFRSLLRAFSEHEIDKDNLPDHLLDILTSTNKFVSEIHGKSNMFATMFVGILDPETGILNYINGGHDPPLVLDMTGKIINKLIPTGPAVGLFPNLDFSVGEINLDDGDILYCYTDGIIDARNNAGGFFTEKKLIDVISSPWSSSFSMLYDLNSSVQKHIGSQDQYDDITQFSLRRKVSTDSDVHVISRKALLENLVELRDFAEAAAVYSFLPQDDAFAFKLATEEICHNIIQYGYEELEPGTITLTFECKQEKALLTITDDGKYFSPNHAKTPNIESDWNERSIGGLGLHFVKELMDKVSYSKTEKNRNKLILEKQK